MRSASAPNGRGTGGGDQVGGLGPVVVADEVDDRPTDVLGREHLAETLEVRLGLPRTLPMG